MFLRLAIFILALAAAAFSQMPSIEPGVSHELAKWRAARYSKVRYKLNLTLEKMSPVLKGTMEIRVNVSPGTSSPGTQAPSPANAGSSGVANIPIIFDWRNIKGSESLSTISNVSFNGRAATLEDQPLIRLLRIDGGPNRPLTFIQQSEHLIFPDGVVAGENVIKLDFTSPILTSGSAITRYVDKEDGAEYIYSLFVPSDASTAFPVFDQPDLKARFELVATVPATWKIVSDSGGRSESWTSKNFLDGKYTGTSEYNVGFFEETRPISTYVFAFAAGPFEKVEDKGRNPSRSEGVQASTSSNLNTLPTGRVSAFEADAASSIYVRKSQAAKFKPHAPEVFRLNREGIKYLEQYFDYKFPFPKYDLVLIPEFPFGGMEHAGATFLRESSIIFPQEPTKSDYISRANLIFHEAAHQWFGDTVTMKWFDDLWLKEGFAEFMAYKTLERVMPEANAWKVFYERNKQAAYLTDSTKGTTPIYQEIANLNSAKSAYGNIVYRKAPSFLKQAEFYLGADKFQSAVRAFLKKHEYANAGWEDLVEEFGRASFGNEIKHIYDRAALQEWAGAWVKQSGMPIFRIAKLQYYSTHGDVPRTGKAVYSIVQRKSTSAAPAVDNMLWQEKTKALIIRRHQSKQIEDLSLIPTTRRTTADYFDSGGLETANDVAFLFPNYQDYGYGIFLLDDKSRDYVLKNIQNEKDDFLRSMMWGSLWDSVREGELDPKEYVELAITNLPSEKDETIVASILGRVSAALNYYVASDQGGNPSRSEGVQRSTSSNLNTLLTGRVSASSSTLSSRFEAVLLDRLQNAPTPGQRITFYRAFVANASTAKGREVLKEMLRQGSGNVRAGSPRSDALLRTKDRFDIVQRLIILADPDALKLLADLEKTETSDDAKRYAYAARAGIATAENKAKYWNDFVNNKDISESWIEAAFGPWNSIRHADLTVLFLERALKELPNHKRSRKIFFINGWLGAFIGGQRTEQALAIVNKFLADNPTLDRDLRLKILENVDLIERAVNIRGKFGNLSY